MKQYNPVTLDEVGSDGQYTAGQLAALIGKLVQPPPPAESGDFLWHTMKGEFIYVSAMQTDHLFNAFRMLFNHGVSPAFRVGKFVRHNVIFDWDRDYKELAYDAMYRELQNRLLNQDQKDELEDIRQNAKAFEILVSQEDPSDPMVGTPYSVD